MSSKGEGNTRMKKRVIHTSEAPEAIGPYSQAVVVESADGGGMVFTAMQIALDPGTMKMIEGGIEEQTRQVLNNLTAVMAAAGAGWGNVVKSVVYLADMGDFAAFNAVYGEVAGDEPPARSAVAVKEVPKGGLVGIELVAVT